MKYFSPILAAFTLLASAPAIAAPNADSTIQRIVANPSYRAAAAALDSGHGKWVEDIVAITQVAAPPFKEQARAKAFAEMLRTRGLDPKTDEVGNVLALRR